MGVGKHLLRSIATCLFASDKRILSVLQPAASIARGRGSLCGIAGAFCYKAGIEPVDRAVIERLNDLQAPRGPDGSGLWASRDGRVVFGHRRLAIIDTGPSGAQPMSTADGRWVITFNGEIYNYRALRIELEKAGRRFSTGSDTEVLIQTIAQWGEAGLLKLRGMFAFALWDRRDNELWLARDPFGIKPLYVAAEAGTIWFASQARRLASCAPTDTSRDTAALTGFYFWGHVPEPFTWWKGIKMFPAGHVQRIRLGGPAPPPRPFFQVENRYTGRPSAPLRPGELRQHVMDSVRHHLVADVPVGLFLSAGIDSTVLAALAAELGTDLRTVTLAFSEYAGTPRDEAPVAELVARRLGARHTTVRVDRALFGELLDGFLNSMDQPTIDGLNTYLVSWAAASEGLKVALSGLGGDELFGGYPSFRQIPTLVAWGRRLPFRDLLGGALRRASALIPSKSIPPKIFGLLQRSGDIPSAYVLRRSLYLEEELSGVLDEDTIRDGLGRLSTIPALSETLSDLRNAGAPGHAQVAALESRWYMRNQLLRDSDWAGMAFGVEVRVPYVDTALLDAVGPAIASPSPPTKRDLANCTDRPPAEVLRRRKSGFTTPVEDWVSSRAGRRRGLRGWAEHVHQSFRADGGRVELGGRAKVA